MRFLKSCHEYVSTEVVATNDNVEACKDVNIAIMIAGYSRKDGLDTKDLMSKIVSIYKDVASVLEQHAAADCKVRNPINELQCLCIRFLGHPSLTLV